MNEESISIAPRRSGFGVVWQVIKTVPARLRFIALLALIGAGFMYKDRIAAELDKWFRPRPGGAATASADSEYWCPMHPTIVRDHSDNCPICGMPLSKRKKGGRGKSDEALPPGIVSRVQLSPYRVAAAGIQTVPVSYQPLTKEINTVGFVEFDQRRLARISVRVTGKGRIDKLYVDVTGETIKKGQPLALLYSPDLVIAVQDLLRARNSNDASLQQMAREKLALWGIDGEQIDAIVKAGKPITQVTIRSPISGHVIKKYQVEGDYVEEGARLFDLVDLHNVWIEAQVYEDDVALMKVGLPVSATTKSFPAREFTGRLAFIHPHLDAGTRTLKVRFDMENPNHELRPGMYAAVNIRVPADQLNLLPGDATEEQKSSHAKGLVLAVPEQAVIDTGRRKIVYRETEPDLFEGVEVQLGPRCGTFYPVIHGLQAGDRIATAGSFLIDAETRLTAGAGSIYFGASGGATAGGSKSATAAVRPSASRDEEDRIRFVLARLSPQDRLLAESQQFCPVLADNRLGSMGAPQKVMVNGEAVFLCCKGCITDALAKPEATLNRIKEFKDRAKTNSTQAASVANELEAKVRANLAKLSPEDRIVAEAQGFCPTNDGNRLGSMGPPVKLTIRGQPVFLCCKVCEEEALAHPDETLDKVEKLRAAVKSSRKGN